MATVERYGSGYSVRYRYETETGEKKQKRVSGFHTKEEAWAAAKELKEKSDAGINVNGSAMTCAELMALWFADRRVGLAVTTKAKYSASIEVLSKTFIAKLKIRQLTHKRYHLLLDQLQEKPVHLRTAVSYTEPLRLSLSWGVAERLIPLNPLMNLRIPKIPKRKQRILTDADVADLVATVCSPERRSREIRIPILLALYAGLRREECAALRWENVDFDHDRITISEAITMTPDGEEHLKDPKTDLSARTISMPAWVMAELWKAYKVFINRPSGFNESRNPTHRVCTNQIGKPYSCKTYSHMTIRLIQEINQKREAKKKLPMPKASFHDLRHTHAAMLIRRNVQPKIISERLGHSTINITMNLYGYLMPGLQDAVAEIFNKEAEDVSEQHES